VGHLTPGNLAFDDRGAVSSAPTEAASYRYWIVARTEDDMQNNRNGAQASNARDVVIPRTGRVRRIFTGAVPQATLSKAQPTTVIADVLRAGNNHPTKGVERALLDFDVTVIKPGMRITQATVQVTQSTTGMPGSFALYKLTGHTFNPIEATWNKASATDPWTTPGGDLDASPLGTVTTPATGAVTFADSATTRGAVQTWVNDQATNHGVAIRAADESVLRLT